jgi:hypothetical protein
MGSMWVRLTTWVSPYASVLCKNHNLKDSNTRRLINLVGRRNAPDSLGPRAFWRSLICFARGAPLLSRSSTNLLQQSVVFPNCWGIPIPLYLSLHWKSTHEIKSWISLKWFLISRSRNNFRSWWLHHINLNLIRKIQKLNTIYKIPKRNLNTLANGRLGESLFTILMWHPIRNPLRKKYKIN